MLNDPNAGGTNTGQMAPAPIFSEESPASSGYNTRRSWARGEVGQISLTSLLVIVAFFAGWFGNLFVNRANYVPPNSDEHLIIQAWDLINDQYVVTSSLDQKKMAYAAIDAMVTSLGDTGHSRFETPEEAKAEQDQLNNNPNVGLGVFLSGGGDQPIRIEAVIPDSPADTAGLKAGDIIQAIDGTALDGKTIDQMRALIGNTPGKQVTLTIQRGSGTAAKTLQITATLGEYTTPIVVSYIIPGLNIADIQIVQFAQGTDDQLRQALQAAKAANVSGIVLDLRDNPGGYLDEAVRVASEFIPNAENETIMVEKTRDGQTTEKGVSGGLATTTPLAILVDNNTASAAEIVAGAVRQNRTDVKVIGQTTFGTGTVLQGFSLADGSVIYLGVEEWLLPNGESVYHKGYVPDQQVALPQDVTPTSVLVAKQGQLTEEQIINSGDTQLLAALDDLTGQHLEPQTQP